MIGIKYCAEGQEEPTQTAKRLFAIASSPYDSRRDSSMLDASMIEVRQGLPDCKHGSLLCLSAAMMHMRRHGDASVYANQFTTCTV